MNDFIIKLINVEDTSEGQGTVDVLVFNKWLLKIGLIEQLISFLDPKLPSESHLQGSQTLIDIIALSYQMPLGYDPAANPQASSHPSCNNRLVAEMRKAKKLNLLLSYTLDRGKQFSASSLIQGICVLMEIIRKYCSEVEIAEGQYHEFTVNKTPGQSIEYPAKQKIIALSTDLNDLFAELCVRLGDFAEVLDNPSEKLFPFEYRMASKTNFGTERIKVCELFAELVHLQYLFTSSPLFDLMVDPKTIKGNNVADGLIMVTAKIIEHSMLTRCIVNLLIRNTFSCFLGIISSIQLFLTWLPKYSTHILLLQLWD